MKQWIDESGQEWGFDIGDAHFFADETFTVELPAGTFSKEQIAQIMGGVPIVRCKDCKYASVGRNEVDSWRWCKVHRCDFEMNDYCSWAERKEE